MSSKPDRPVARLLLDRDALDELCEADQHRLLDAFAELRQQLASGRFGEIDNALGHQRGWFGRVVRGERSIDHRRLLRATHILGQGPARFFARAFPVPLDHPAPLGLLPRLIERPARSDPPPWHARLREWSRAVEISAQGKHFDFEPADLLRLLKRDFDTAERVCISAIECTLGLSDGYLTPESTVRVARWLTIAAAIMRIRGDSPTSAELFDIAFCLEQPLDSFACRSFIFRNACYLLSDWGQLAEAEYFSRAAIDLASLAGDLDGLGLSHYAHATISLYMGKTTFALREYRSCSNYFDDPRSEKAICVLQITALLQSEQGDLPAALETMATLDESLVGPISKPTLASVALTKGELASIQEEHAQAELYFDEALAIFQDLGDITNAATVSLFDVRHCFRYGKDARARIKVNNLLSWGNDRRITKLGQATLYEIARHCHRGEVTVAILSKLIEGWRSIAACNRSVVTSS